MAEGTKSALYGDMEGEVTRVSVKALPYLRGALGEAVRVPCPDLETPSIMGLKPVITEGTPDLVLIFRYYTDVVGGLTVYACFDKGRGVWYVRELRGADGRPSGRFHKEA